MFLVAYDIENNRTRARFSKFLTRFGVRIQLSLFQIRNSPRVLENVKIGIETNFRKDFGQADSVLVFRVPDDACIAKFGYPMDDDTDLVVR